MTFKGTFHTIFCTTKAKKKSQFSIHLYFQSDPDPQPCRKLSRTHSGPGAAVVVVKVVALGPGRMSIFGLQSSRGELDRADQVRYMMYIEIREDCSSPELGICS